MKDELCATIALSRGRVDGGHPEPNRIASLESVVECAIERLARAKEVSHISVQNQMICLCKRGNGSDRCQKSANRQGCRHQQNSRDVAHELKITQVGPVRPEFAH